MALPASSLATRPPNPGAIRSPDRPDGRFSISGANLGTGARATERADDHDRDTEELFRRHEHHRPRPTKNERLLPGSTRSRL